MAETVFKHNDPDEFHGRELTLHDCIAEEITCRDGVLSFRFPEGFWITMNHEANPLHKVVRTDEARVDFTLADPDDLSLDVYTRRRHRKTVVDDWNLNDLLEAVNSGRCRLEFIYQYRSYFEQLWRCALRSAKRPYYREVDLHIPLTRAVYRWNELVPEREW